jgi:hypothetical protein
MRQRLRLTPMVVMVLPPHHLIHLNIFFLPE